MFTERTSVGLDVHARSVVGCGLDTVTGETARRRVVPTFEGVKDWLPAPVAVAYEAGPTGFGLARQLTAAGIRCVEDPHTRSDTLSVTKSRDLMSVGDQSRPVLAACSRR